MAELRVGVERHAFGFSNVSGSEKSLKMCVSLLENRSCSRAFLAMLLCIRMSHDRLDAWIGLVVDRVREAKIEGEFPRIYRTDTFSKQVNQHAGISRAKYIGQAK